MTSDGVGSAEQNEYEDSYKRFKTLLFVGIACICLGVIVVISGNRLQLPEVQRLGIIFSSFGIAWIVLSIAYLFYMKCCFTVVEGEKSTLHSVTSNVERVGSMSSRTLARSPSSPSKMLEIPQSADGRSLGSSTSLEKRCDRSVSPVQSDERFPPESRLERSSQKIKKRSYSVINFKSPSYPERNCKKLTTSFRNFERPLSSRTSFDKHVELMNNTRASLSSEKKFENLPYSALQLERRSPVAAASVERYFQTRTPSEENYKMSSSAPEHCEIPAAGLGNFEKQIALGKNSDRRLSSVNYCDVCFTRTFTNSTPPAENFGKLAALDENVGPSTSYKIASQDSFPPNYYEVVLHMPKAKDS